MMPTASPTNCDRTANSTQHPLWAKAIAQPAVEFGPVSLPVIAGTLPPGLQGTLYRNGPGRLTRGGKTVAHWFDGDGGILAVHLRSSGATGLYRYVQTAGYQAEAAAGRFLYPGYGQQAAGPFWQRWGQSPKNAANTSVLALPDKLLALWEGGLPHNLDLETLETLGLETLSSLSDPSTYSAHPKVDPATGAIYNFGVNIGPQPTITLYRSAPGGEITAQGKIALDRLSLVHDFTLAGPYLIFLVPPLKLQLLPLLIGWKSFSQAFDWLPQLGTQVIVVDRDTLQEVRRFEVESWFQWHIGNGFLESDGTVVIDLVQYQDFQTNEWLREVVSGHPQTPAPGQLWRIRLDLQSGQLRESAVLLDHHCDFPIVPPQGVGQPVRSLYVAARSSATYQVEEMFNSIAQVDPETGRKSLAELPEGCYCMEPIYACDRNNPTQGWILTVVYDGHQDQSTLQIFPADHLSAGPACILALPQVIPFGFHGTWKSRP